jgi:prephenate dehydratase
MTHTEAADAAYQGAPGAYSEEAAWALVGPEARLLPCHSLAAMFDAVGAGRARHAVLPCENSLAGTVPRAYELLVERGLSARAETRVRIDHVLVGPEGAAVAGLRRVLSHPVALDQCRRFFAAHPGIEPVPVFDTAGAVAMALAEPAQTTAAVASRRAAALHGAAVLAHDIQDHRENWTRFLLLSSAPAEVSDEAFHAIVSFTVPHTPGALARALQAIAGRGGNMTKIESHPIEGQPFEYAFLLEVSSQAPGSDLRDVLAALRGVVGGLRLLGAY